MTLEEKVSIQLPAGWIDPPPNTSGKEFNKWFKELYHLFQGIDELKNLRELDHLESSRRFNDEGSIDLHFGGYISLRSQRPRKGPYRGNDYCILKQMWKGIKFSMFRQMGFYGMSQMPAVVSRGIKIPRINSVNLYAIEYLKVPKDCIGLCIIKSTEARKGLSSVQGTSVFFPGWEGFPLLEVNNATNDKMVLELGTPIAQMVFFPYRGGTYNGQYQNQRPK